jgi:hypothetical protein
MIELPFWEDYPFPDVKPTPPTSLYPRFLIGIIAVYRWLLLGILLVVPAVLFAYVSPWLLGLYILLLVYFISITIYRRKKFLSNKNRISQIQDKARQRTGCEIIGSAIHVAGHPALQREQPVVLALLDGRLVLYPYERAVPLDEMALSQIKNVQTVVYDDEHVPHVDVIDPAAQAIQITFQRDQGEFTCLFRRLRNLRSIDWYHAIQQARKQASF